MGLKQWISRFAAGLGLDTVDSTGMETLVQDQDGSHVAQIHAVRDSIIAMQKALLLVGIGSPWFEWNGVDMSQFGDKIDADRVSSSTIAVEEFGGLNWLTMQVTSIGGGSPNGHNTSCILPIATTPPSADYVVTADILILTYTTSVTAGVVARYNTTSFAGYGQRFSGGSYQQIVRLSSTGSNRDAPTLIGFVQGDPDMAANRGSRLHLEARGTGSDVILRMLAAGGEHQLARETANLHTTAQKAGLWVAAAATSSTVKVGFRNIRCFSMAA